jgi:hypothetical protein
MAKIIPFPDKSGPNLAEVEKRIKGSLYALGSDDDMVEYVSGRVMAFIEKYTCKTFEPRFSLPLRPMPEEQTRSFMQALEAGVDAIAEQVYDMVNKIIMERLFLEVEIYEATRGLKDTGMLGSIPAVMARLPEGYPEQVGYLADQLKDPALKAHERYLLNKLLASVLATKPQAASQARPL